MSDKRDVDESKASRKKKIGVIAIIVAVGVLIVLDFLLGNKKHGLSMLLFFSGILILVFVSWALKLPVFKSFFSGNGKEMNKAWRIGFLTGGVIPGIIAGGVGIALGVSQADLWRLFFIPLWLGGLLMPNFYFVLFKKRGNRGISDSFWLGIAIAISFALLWFAAH